VDPEAPPHVGPNREEPDVIHHRLPAVAIPVGIARALEDIGGLRRCSCLVVASAANRSANGADRLGTLSGRDRPRIGTSSARVHSYGVVPHPDSSNSVWLCSALEFSVAWSLPN
jgi:hypothetical protein